MKATVRNDDDKGRGHALLIIHFTDEDDKPHKDETFSLAVRSHPSKTFLQPPGAGALWMAGSETYIPVKAREWDGQDLILELGPYFTNAFVDKIHFFFLKGSFSNFPSVKAETYKVWKPLRDMNIDLPLPPQVSGFEETPDDSTKVNRPEPTPSPEDDSLEPIDDFTPPPPPPELEPPVPVPATPEQPKPAETPKLSLEKKLLPPTQPPTQPPTRPPSPRGRRLAWPILLVLLILAGVGGWLYYDQKKTPEPPATPRLEEPPAAPVKPDEPPPPTQGPLLPLDEARKLLRDKAPEADLLAAVDRFDGIPGAEDAVFLLLRRLAPTSADRQARFAAFFDPLDQRPSGSVQKNAKDAYDEYELAKKAGDQTATARQEALVNWAKAPENKDNAGARDLLKMLNKGL
ncbi:MAG: hypothetical protein LBR11_09730 [Deltaproteobacteria bacterium]|jgi:hypothetical protein|nr:hypothetical protein [Deltaproteobacteria bacterium]